jgi:hypothetical protein
MSYALLVFYNLAVLFGCGYVVFGLGHSGWWFALALICLASSKSSDDEE